MKIIVAALWVIFKCWSELECFSFQAIIKGGYTWGGNTFFPVFYGETGGHYLVSHQRLHSVASLYNNLVCPFFYISDGRQNTCNNSTIPLWKKKEHYNLVEDRIYCRIVVLSCITFGWVYLFGWPRSVFPHLSANTWTQTHLVVGICVSDYIPQ